MLLGKLDYTNQPWTSCGVLYALFFWQKFLNPMGTSMCVLFVSTLHSPCLAYITEEGGGRESKSTVQLQQSTYTEYSRRDIEANNNL